MHVRVDTYVGTKMSSSCQLSCDYKGTPLRLVNANIGILYMALAVAAVSIYFYLGNRVMTTFDKNIYTLRNVYNGVFPIGNAVASATIETSTPTLVFLMMMLFFTNMLFHFGYAIDFKRAYTVMLIDRCNKLRWIQFAITNTILTLFAAHISGTTSLDFFLIGLLALPAAGAFGFLMDKTSPCFPGMFWVSYIGLIALTFLAPWAVIVYNFSVHSIDSGVFPPGYLYTGIIALATFHLILIVLPYIQTRSKIKYSSIELLHSFMLFAVSAAMFGVLVWLILNSP